MLLLFLALMLQPAEAVEAVPRLDLEKYVGKWYEVARFPNSFQKSCRGNVTAEYALLDEGGLSVVNRCREEDGSYKEAEGRARIADEKGPASKLEVRFAPAFLSFLPFVWGDYWVLYLDSDYTYAAVGSPDRKYLWILSRTPEVPAGRMEEISRSLEGMGFETARLRPTRQEWE